MNEVVSRRLQRVYLSSDTYSMCLTHALSTEKEEVMGLLLGDVDEVKGYSNISSYLILRRSDKQPDRVEISDDQLAHAASYAEGLSKRLKRPMRVVGWYHSHPHITVVPSHVDVRTQAMYQMMDSYFIGLIFSTFPNEVTNNQNSIGKKNELQLICFQSQIDNKNPNNYERLEIPIYIKETTSQLCNLKIMTELPDILNDEEESIVLSEENLEKIEKDPIILLHNKAHKFNSMLHITSKIARPLYENVISRIEINKMRIKILENERAQLLQTLKENNI